MMNYYLLKDSNLPKMQILYLPLLPYLIYPIVQATVHRYALTVILKICLLFFLLVLLLSFLLDLLPIASCWSCVLLLPLKLDDDYCCLLAGIEREDVCYDARERCYAVRYWCWVTIEN